MTSGEHLISVIVPVYNGERYLGEALRSALAQTYRPIEIVVVDDGSTDGTAKVVRGFGEAVRYWALPHQGAGAARNQGVAQTRGNLLAFLDADDVWCEEKLLRQVAALDRIPSPDLVFGHVEYFFSPDLSVEERHKIQLPSVPLPGLLPTLLLARRQAFDRVGPFETTHGVGEFISWFLRASELRLPYVMLPEVLARRRIHRHNTVQVRSASYVDYVRILKASLDRRRAASRASMDEVP